MFLHTVIQWKTRLMRMMMMMMSNGRYSGLGLSYGRQADDDWRDLAERLHFGGANKSLVDDNAQPGFQ